MTPHEFAGILTAFIIGFLLILVLLVLWWQHDARLDDIEAKLGGLVLGGPEPLVLVDEPTQPQPVETPTEPMARVDVAGGARVRPSPRPRTDVDLSAFTFDPEAVSHRRRS